MVGHTSFGVKPGTSLATLSQLIGCGAPQREPSTMSKTRMLLSYGKLLLEQKRLMSAGYLKHNIVDVKYLKYINSIL